MYFIQGRITMSFVVTKEWLKNRQRNNHADTIVIDVRFNMADPEAGRKSYEEGHIPHAVYLDLNKDLSGPAQKHGGGRPLPDVRTFSEKLGALGIDQDKTVIIYDQKNGIFAARAWWLLHYLGHEKVYVLEGGFKEWTKAGNIVTRKIKASESTVFEPNVLQE